MVVNTYIFSAREICLRCELESGIPYHSLTIICEQVHSLFFILSQPSSSSALVGPLGWMAPNGVPSLGLSY